MTITTQFEKSLRILYIGLKYDYGFPERGYSYEHVNFFDTLRRMNGVNVEFFAFDEIMRSVGRKAMNARLLSVVQERKPDICFFVLFTDEFEKDTIRQITEQSGATTLGWFGDDHWRFSTFSRHYAPLLHWVLTTDSEAVEKYHALGCRHVIKTQWGVNHCIYTKHDLPADFDVTFIGQVHSQRKQIVRRLRQSGIDVKCWGKGWESGRLSQEEMITMYSRSKINLNFTESSVAFGWKPIAKIFLNRRADDSIVLNDPVTMMNSIKVLFKDRRPQIKGRNFEIPGSGGFLLTSRADNLEEYFVPGKEIVVFNGTDDLIEKVRYYLSHDDEREAIRRAGYLRAIREHTYDRRFREILRTIGYGVE